ncbi:glycerophosphodiester phosphodiesterase family protein [Streptomyces hirsutus]|uniref:Glycerophosphodiester phosphodiesterase family protein n=1 Tax=Streptomyces hirsutus TaxID=35620 RepID=A0ABZ1GG71_9ACTN|nr:glycerophosphodiester phosphodiesterase family protein [Streptomyces hirsutus]WSD05129.1 glycerophosphodiester phosphodiesterase family protein [Streptomyces hirsutus]WTD21476.1 glycerophosphodiester phosphodiesterase family protein [Streptomyces hirsutus]
MNFLTIGHRGVMGVEPENTLRSFVAAQEAGLDVIELDLHLSKDGALVVMHDADLDRTTDGTGPIADRTVAELRALDAGRGERIPVLEEVLDAVHAPLQAEIKDVQAARALAEVMNRRDLVGRIEVSSFHDDALTEIARLVPGVRTALVASFPHSRMYSSGGTPIGPDVVERAVGAGASTVCLNIRRLTLEIVEQARKADLRIIGWVVNTQDHLRLVRALGLDGATTDYPEIKRTGRFTA